MADAIKKIGFGHEGLMNSMLAHPEWSSRDHAVALGYTPAWVSQVVNSDMFQAELHSRAREAGVILGVSIQEKMRATLQLTLEKASERIENGACSERFITDTMRNLAATAEFAPRQAPVGPTYNLTVTPEYLEEVRQRSAAAKRGQTAAKVGSQEQERETGQPEFSREMIVDVGLM